MADVTKKEKSIELICECGNIHTITQNNEGELEVTSQFKKANKQNLKPDEQEVKDVPKKSGTVFDCFN
jgi:hypothetical protein